MIDGNCIFDDAAAIAYPRYPATEGDAKAISWLESRFREMGLEATLQWFTYDLRPAQRALQSVLVASAFFVAAAGFATTRSPVAGLILLVAAFVPGAVFLAWSPWLEKLYRREGGTRTANVIGRRGVADPRMTLMLMAHHDSKSQSLSFPFRMGLTITTIGGAVRSGVAGIDRHFHGQPPGLGLVRTRCRRSDRGRRPRPLDHEEWQQVSRRCRQRGICGNRPRCRETPDRRARR